MLESVYTSKARLVQDGLSISDWPDDRVTSLIRWASRSVDDFTRQRFAPLPETVAISGRGDQVVHRRDLLPILQLDSLTVDDTRTFKPVCVPRPYTAASGTVTDYVLRPEGVERRVELIQKAFPPGVGNIVLAGVFGWIEPSDRKGPFTFTLAANLDETDSRATLNSVVGLNARDLLVVGTSVILFVDKVYAATNEVEFTPCVGLLSASILSGTTVRTWGPPPRGIEAVTAYTAMLGYRRQLGLEEDGVVDPSLIRSEQTDHYRYETWAPYQLTGLRGMAGITGNREMDEVLLRYSAPPYPAAAR